MSCGVPNNKEVETAEDKAVHVDNSDEELDKNLNLNKVSLEEDFSDSDEVRLDEISTRVLKVVEHNPEEGGSRKSLDEISNSVNEVTDLPNIILENAASLGGLLFSAVNFAGKALTDAGSKLVKRVGSSTILGEFTKEQDEFIAQRGEEGNNGVPPWIGCENEEAVREECLSISTDDRNFLRSPPAGTEFVFDYQTSYPVALAIMKEDANIEGVRYRLVPKRVSEENFWRNYFYRTSLICDANAKGGIFKKSQVNPLVTQELEKSWAEEIEEESMIL